MAEVLLTTVVYEGGIEIKIYAEETNGGVSFRVESTGTNQQYDINGLFLDLGNDGGAIDAAADSYDFNGAQSINMTGADSADGTTFDGWDSVFALSKTGLKDGAVQEATEDLNGGTLFVEGVTLEDLAGAEVGVRLTSVASLDGGSLKLSYEVPPPPNNFPDTPPGEISEITLYFNTTDGDVSGDGVYTVKIDAVTGADPNLDTWFDEVMAYLTTNDPVVAGNAEDLLGVTIKHGDNPESFYAIDGDPDSDPLPDPPGDFVATVDTIYVYNDLFPTQE